MTFIDLCAGIGGISLGLERAGMTCIGQVEYDDFCNRVLERHWPHVPRWGDITALDPACLPTADLIAGGYPCQPFSFAGERRGAEDDRHLWPYVRKIVAHIRPPWCLFENVAGHVTLGLDEVLTEMEALGYTCGPLVIPACAVDAPHRRDRVWILADSTGLGRREGRAESTAIGREASLVHGGASVAHAEVVAERAGLRPGVAPGERWGRPGDRSGEGGTVLAVYPHAHGNAGGEERHLAALTNGAGQPGGLPAADWRDWQKWQPEPGVGRVAHGIPHRVDRLRGLGNAVVPQVVEVIGRAILAAEEAYR